MPAYVSNFKPLTESKEEPKNDNPFSLTGLEALDRYYEDKKDSPRHSHSYEVDEDEDDRDSVKSEDSYHSSRSSKSYHSSKEKKQGVLSKYSTYIWISAFFLLLLSGGWLYYQQHAYDIEEDKDLSVIMADRQQVQEF